MTKYLKFCGGFALVATVWSLALYMAEIYTAREAIVAAIATGTSFAAGVMHVVNSRKRTDAALVEDYLDSMYYSGSPGQIAAERSK